MNSNNFKWDKFYWFIVIKIIMIWKLQSEESTIKFLQERGILLTEKTCLNRHQLNCISSKFIFWNYNVTLCRTHIGVHTAGCTAVAATVMTVRFICCWAKKLTSVVWWGRQLNMSKSTTLYRNMYMQVLQQPGRQCKTGGPGYIIKVDKNLLTRQKQNMGRITSGLHLEAFDASLQSGGWTW